MVLSGGRHCFSGLVHLRPFPKPPLFISRCPTRPYPSTLKQASKPKQPASWPEGFGQTPWKPALQQQLILALEYVQILSYLSQSIA